MFIFIYLFIWLRRVLVVAHGIFHLQHEGPLAVTCPLSVVPRGNLVSWPGIKPRPPTLGLQSLSLWAPREISSFLLLFEWPQHTSRPHLGHTHSILDLSVVPLLSDPCTAASLPIRPPLWCVSHASFSFLWILKVSVSPPPRHWLWGPPTVLRVCYVYVVPVRTPSAAASSGHSASPAVAPCHPAIPSHCGSATPCLGSFALLQAKDISSPPFYKTYKAQQIQWI